MERTSSDVVSPSVYIGGAWRVPGSETRQVLNPATEEVIGAAGEASVDDALDAAKAAREAQPAWEHIGLPERSRLLRALAEAVRSDAERLGALTAAETGMPLGAGIAYVTSAARSLDDVAERAENDHTLILGPTTAFGARGPQDVTTEVERRPVGVVACITPFNAPILEVTSKAGSALIMGNSVVIKPAPVNPLVVIEFVRLCDQVGFPPGVVNLVTASDPEVSAALCTSRDVDMVSFTGSTAVGEAIYRAGASTMKRLLLELGGKGACIVTEDADLELAADVVETVWTLMGGQICAAPTRVLVADEVYDAFVEILTERARAATPGIPDAPGTTVWPVISAAQRERIESFVERAREEGAVIATGGSRPDVERGFFVAPAVLLNCTQEMEAVRTEIFGPIVTVQRFSSDEEAIELANDSDYGLVDHVFASEERSKSIVPHLRAGVVNVNFSGFVEGIPVGGFKKSGLGRAHGDIGLLSYTEICAVNRV